MLGKMYFAMYLCKIKIRSVLCKTKLRLFGAKIGRKTTINNIDICGYVNNIKIGKKCTIEKDTKFIINKEGSIDIGENTLLGYNVIVVAGIGKITIGSNTMIAANTYVINSDHDINNTLSVRKSGNITKDISIGNNVWIGANCSILKGVKIGEGSIIGAGSVVTKDIPPYSVAFGVPCKVIKKRYDTDVLIRKLEQEGYLQQNIDKIINEMYGNI